MDAALPDGGLRVGATHEWLGYTLDAREDRSADWVPPISVLWTLARHSPLRPVFIGRRCWPCPSALGPLAAAAVYLDPRDDAERLWALDQTLRTPGVLVIGDATRLDMGASRRLQLAAEAGGTLALLTRPPWERPVISAAETRWRVRPEPGGTTWGTRWSLELLRCKGAPLSTCETWVVEVHGETVAVCGAAGLADRPGQAQAPARRIA